MKLLLIIPAVIYIMLLVINFGLFQVSSEINFFWIFRFDIPVVISITLFFIIYMLIIWAGLSFGNVLTNMRIKKLEKENFDLKSKLLTEQGNIIKNIETTFDKKIGEFKSEADKKINISTNEVNKITGKKQYNLNAIKERFTGLGRK